MNQFIIIVDTNDHLNMISRISAIFSKRRISFDSLQASIHQKEKLQRFVIGITETNENARKLSKQIEKQIDVISVNLFENIK